MAILYCSCCGAGGLEYQSGESAYRCINCNETQYRNSKPAVCAVISRANLVLLVRSSSSMDKWDLPGGFLLHGEAPEDGLRRELSEELNARVEIKRLMTAIVDPYGPNQEFSLNLFYEASLVSGALQAANEITEFSWFSLNDLPTLAYEGTRKVLLDYRNGLAARTTVESGTVDSNYSTNIIPPSIVEASLVA